MVAIKRRCGLIADELIAEARATPHFHCGASVGRRRRSRRIALKRAGRGAASLDDLGANAANNLDPAARDLGHGRRNSAQQRADGAYQTSARHQRARARWPGLQRALRGRQHIPFEPRTYV